MTLNTPTLNYMKAHKGHIAPMIKPLGYEDTKGELAVFSLADVVLRVLQTDRTAREMAIKASKLWKSGELYRKLPTKYTDIMDGSRFRDSFDMCGKSVDEAELRIVLAGWEDDFTVCAREFSPSVCVTMQY